MGKRKERRVAAASGRRVKLDLFAEPSGNILFTLIWLFYSIVITLLMDTYWYTYACVVLMVFGLRKFEFRTPVVWITILMCRVRFNLCNREKNSRYSRYDWFVVIEIKIFYISCGVLVFLFVLSNVIAEIWAPNSNAN